MSRYFVGYKSQHNRENFNKESERWVLPQTASNFIADLLGYFWMRIIEFFRFVAYSVVLGIDKFSEIKAFLVRNMFWGRSNFYKIGTNILVGLVTVIVGFTNISQQISKVNALENEFSTEYVASEDIVKSSGSIQDLSGTVSPIATLIPSITYAVKVGDGLDQVARYFVQKDQEFYQEFGTTLDINDEVIERKKSVVKLLNNLSGENPKLKVGQVLVSYNFDGIVYEVKNGDTLTSISKKFEKDIEEVISLNSYWLPKSNEVKSGDKVILTSVLVKEPPKPVVVAVKPTPKPVYKPSNVINVPTPSGAQFIRPLEGGCGIVTQNYKPTHSGVDIAKNGGCRIIASSNGIVTHVGWVTTGGGFMVKIDHGNGFSTEYAHGSGVFYVKKGDSVSQGQPVMYMGSTGNSTGTHLHFVVKYLGKYVNPQNYVKL